MNPKYGYNTSNERQKNTQIMACGGWSKCCTITLACILIQHEMSKLASC